MEALRYIQGALKAPKAQRNGFGNYNYRSCEDILEAVKPLLTDVGAMVTISDSIEAVGGRVYIKATATIKCGEEQESVTAYARESETKKGMDEAQITGSASSYARKYSLNGLFLIDDTKDADTQDNRPTKADPAAVTFNDAADYPHIITLMNNCANLEQLKTAYTLEWKNLGADEIGKKVLASMKDRRKKELS